MKKRHLLIGSLALLPSFTKAQTEPEPLPEKISKTEIELVYNHYVQEGNHSAVTGGLGTEELTVYGPMINLKKSAEKHALAFNFGADIISSASTDKIDYVVSSASVLDARSYVNATYSRPLGKRNLNLQAGQGFSIESDYFSLATKLGIDKEDPVNLRTWSAQFQFFNDDLRWGRLNPGYHRPVKLIYPAELRYREWFDGYKRYSYNLKLSLTQVLNKRNVLGIFPDLAYQHGLLSTPFHRVYFTDGSLRVENLPESRWKGALALRLNSFAGGRFVLKNTLNGYADNFGIAAFSAEHETVFKLKPGVTLLPNARFYLQQGSRYFAGYALHQPTETFYTSDYDLSAFRTFDLGFGLKCTPFAQLSERMQFRSLLFRYNYMHRSDNLSAHIFSVAFQTEFTKKKAPLPGS